MPETSASGTVYTFYSFKGGVGRTMALANVAALMAKWGFSVLAVDWDLEAPGLERFFSGDSESLKGQPQPGLVDLIEGYASDSLLDWRACVRPFRVNGSENPVSYIPAQGRCIDYFASVQALDFEKLFEGGFGRYVEELRTEWIREYDFVLIDSRTGVTDIGGICTVHLADALVLLFTATDTSVNGVVEVAERARRARQKLPVDRDLLLAVPVPARDESRTEYERALEWRNKFANRFEKHYRDWLPPSVPLPAAIEALKVPYVPYWSFGEGLPALAPERNDLGQAYETLGRLLTSRLDWARVVEGQSAAPPPRSGRRVLDRDWLQQCRSEALDGLAGTNQRVGYFEVSHFSPDSALSGIPQLTLLEASRLAMVHTFGWPIGAVLDRDDAKPTPTNRGVRAKIRSDWLRGGLFEYWYLTSSAEFYSLSSLFEDERGENAIFFDTRIVNATEAVQHCIKLYRALDMEGRATVEMAAQYGRLKGRQLSAASQNNSMRLRPGPVNNGEDSTVASVTFRLDADRSEIVRVVKELCEPLFVLFDFQKFGHQIYEDRVLAFLDGRVI